MDLSQLTSRQLEAVVHQGTPLMVLAGPGTGKTHTLTSRIGYGIQERGIPAEKILAVTFTNQAAEEMAARVRRLLKPGSGPAAPWTTTFHGFGYRVLHQLLSEPPTLLSENEAVHLLKETVKKFRPDFPLQQLKELSRRISLAKGSLQPAEARDSLPAWRLFPDWSDLYQGYEQQLAARHCWDFDDLITQTVYFLENRAEFRERIWTEFPWVFVDEFQDINAARYRLFRLVTGPNRDWMVIGDPNQAIYGFRGARADFFSRLRKEADPTKEIFLEETFRLSRTILEASRQIMAASAGSAPITLTTAKPGGPTVTASGPGHRR